MLIIKGYFSVLKMHILPLPPHRINYKSRTLGQCPKVRGGFFMVNEVGERKVRSDKKRDIKPTISVQLYECVNRLSYITNTPIKDVGVMICKKGLYSTVVIEYLSNYFRRNYWANNNTMYIGELDRASYIFDKGIPKQRMTMRFTQSDHDKLARLAYSLDLTISSAVALLLETSIKNTDIVNAFISNQARKELDPQRMKQLREIIKYINQNNPYEKEISLGATISMIMEEVKETAFTMSESVKHWMKNL